MKKLGKWVPGILIAAVIYAMLAFGANPASAEPFTWRLWPSKVVTWDTEGNTKIRYEYALKYGNAASYTIDEEMNEQWFIFGLYLYRPHIAVTASLMKEGVEYHTGWFGELHHSFFGTSETLDVQDITALIGKEIPYPVWVLWEEIRDDPYVVLFAYNMVSGSITLYLHPRFFTNRMFNKAYLRRLNRIFKRYNFDPYRAPMQKIA